MRQIKLIFILFFVGFFFVQDGISQQSDFYFIVPQIGNGESPATAYRPKYFATSDSRISRISSMPIGLDSLFLVKIIMEESLRDSIAGLSDVIAFKKDINATLNAGAVTATKNKLEAKKIPAGWVSTSTTWKDIIRFVALVAQMHQRFKGLFGEKLLPAGITLNTTYSQLPTAGKNKLISLADSFGFSKESLTGASTIREILKELVLQWNQKIVLGGINFQ